VKAIRTIALAAAAAALAAPGMSVAAEKYFTSSQSAKASGKSQDMTKDPKHNLVGKKHALMGADLSKGKKHLMGAHVSKKANKKG
jgi:hypothetical protein